MLRTSILAIVIVGGILGSCGVDLVLAADGCCAQCGRHCDVAKVCRRVESTKQITVTCWGLQNEEFCLPGPSTPDCECSEQVCDADGCCLHGRPRSLFWINWLPSDRAKIFTRRKLMKRTVTRTVPTCKWVVEDVCAGCRGALPK